MWGPPMAAMAAISKSPRPKSSCKIRVPFRADGWCDGWMVNLCLTSGDLWWIDVNKYNNVNRYYLNIVCVYIYIWYLMMGMVIMDKNVNKHVSWSLLQQSSYIASRVPQGYFGGISARWVSSFNVTHPECRRDTLGVLWCPVVTSQVSWRKIAKWCRVSLNI